jgi:hypothetical protein
MKPHQIASAWISAFGSSGPAGFLCRTSIPAQWVRIHSLPDSKRYPDDESERMEIVRRHLIVADCVIGNADCILFVTRFGSSVDPAHASLSGWDDLTFSHVEALDIEEEDWSDSIRFFAAPFRSSPENLRPLILASAEDSLGSILFANFERGTAYAPYDGGADLFFPSHSQAADARSNWKPWLSFREDGL